METPPTSPPSEPSVSPAASPVGSSPALGVPVRRAPSSVASVGSPGPIAGRVPPHSLTAEAAVLGGILLENAAIPTVIEILVPDDFYVEANRLVYQAALDLFEAGQPADFVTLKNKLESRQALAGVGGPAYLASLVDQVPSVANIEHHARIVKEKASVRRMIAACHQVLGQGYGDYGEVEEYLDQAERAVFEVAKARVRAPYVHIKDVVHATFEEIQRAAERGERITGTATGFDRIDKKTAGLQRGDLIIVAGRPGMGKTAFCLNIATYVSQKGSTVAVFSLEMPREQLVRRMLCSEARVDAAKLRAGMLSREDWPAITRAAGMISELPLYLDDSPGLSVLELRAKARRLKSEAGLALVVIDYLQLMRGRQNAESREREISEISRSLKELAKELSIPVMALSQLNRAVETRGTKDKRPQLSDLRESGALEQDADLILFIYRDEVYNREPADSDNRGIAEVIIGKQRNGPTGTVRLRFVNELTRFDNLAEEEMGPADDDGAY